ncbi:MAG: hypothetical protein SH848_12705 [Saprospiraceae bacterium]|nr:hypothetical protein [Saprospiraceae bacterium]
MRFPRLFILLFAVSLSALCACQNDPLAGEGPLPSRRDLMRAMRQSGAMLVVYGEAQGNLYQALADSMRAHPEWRGLKLEAKSDAAVTEEELTQKPLLLLGTAISNRIIRRLAAQLPVQLEDRRFQFDGNWYEAAKDMFKLFTYPNPLNVKLPIFLFTGNDDAEIAALLKQKYAGNWPEMLRSGWGYEVYANSELRIAGNLADSTWRFDKAIHFNFTNGKSTLFQTGRFKFTGQADLLPKARLDAMAAHCEATFSSICGFLNKPCPPLEIAYRLFGSVEDKGLQNSSMRIAEVNFNKQEVAVVVNETFRGDQLQMENELLLRSLLGAPKTEALEKGLAIRFSSNWYEKGWDHWAQRLYCSGNLPPMADLIDNELFNNESDLVMGCTAAAFADFLIAHWGKDDFLLRYASWQAGAAERKDLEAAWEKYLAQRYADCGKFTVKPEKLPYLKGYNFSHEGYRVYNGYGSKLAQQSIQKLNGIGGNAIAIVPYSYMESHTKPSFLPIADGGGDENDESVVYAHAAAQKLGMKTVLKPQIWLSRSWTGYIEMSSEADWQAFFGYYYRWIRHYALLAEIYDFDALSVAVEMVKTTRQRPDDWRRMIAKIRKLYSGQLTYSANWGEDFEQLAFGDQLDFIGLNCYYPLSPGDNPTRQELEQRFEQVMEKAEAVSRKFNKPIVFTEIGFRSVQAPWKNPHEEENGRPQNMEHQKLCYEVVGAGLKGKNWCHGVLWWKWPSYLDFRGDSFTPTGKLAEVAVGAWFKVVE